MKLVIEQELAQQCLNAIAKLPYQDVFQLVPKMLQLPVLTDTSFSSVQSTEIKEVVETASTEAAQEIAKS